MASKGSLGPGTEQKIATRQEEAAARAKEHDRLMKARATEGCRDKETADAVLAMGGDATRSSPVREQVLNDWEPGLTTTTGAYNCPIDPTTAAVPTPVGDPDLASGTPTIGSDKHGAPEERFKGPEGGDKPEDRLSKLPDREEWEKKEAEAAKEAAAAGEKSGKKAA